MRIIKYDTRLDADKLPMLVKENSFNYGKRKIQVTNPSDIYWFFQDVENAEYLDREFVFLICMDVKNKILGYFKVSEGTVNTSLLSPREVFIKALAVGAASIILVHNHPTGDPTPSNEDINITKQIKNAGEILRVNLLDHIILGENKYYSFNEGGLL